MAFYDTRGAMRDELAQRGYNHIGGRLDLFVDEAAVELHLEELWDFRRQVIAGPAPLAIDAEAIVKHVRETGSGVRYWPMSESDALNEGAGGSGREYYVEGAGLVRTHPESATDLTIVLYGVKPWTVGGFFAQSDADVPLVPRGYRDVIVKLAEVRAALDDGRSEHAATLRQGEIAIRLNQMREACLRQGDEPRTIRPESIW